MRSVAIMFFALIFIGVGMLGMFGIQQMRQDNKSDRETPFYRFDYTKPFSNFLPYTMTGCSEQARITAEDFLGTVFGERRSARYFLGHGIIFGHYFVSVGHLLYDVVGRPLGPDNINYPEAVQIFEEGQFVFYPIRPIWYTYNPDSPLEEFPELADDISVFEILPNDTGKLPDMRIPGLAPAKSFPTGTPLCIPRYSDSHGERVFLYEGWLANPGLGRETFAFWGLQVSYGSSGAPIIALRDGRAMIIGMQYLTRKRGADPRIEEKGQPVVFYNARAQDLGQVLEHIREETGINLYARSP